MKKKLLVLLGIMALIIVISSTIIRISTKNVATDVTQDEVKLQIVTTFYPVYMIGLNLMEGVESVDVKSLTDLNTGCLHDYQLTTEDMKIISTADVMLINGGGMEGFLEDIMANYPDLTIIDASQGIEMLPSAEEHASDEADSAKEPSEEGSEEEHDHGEWNAHVWLDPLLYIKQIENVTNNLSDYIKNSEMVDLSVVERLDSNAESYTEKVRTLDQQIVELSNELNSENTLMKRDAVIFHDAFAYLANRVGITVAHTIPLDSDTVLVSAEIGEIIDEVNLGSIQYLFTEEQYSDHIASQIAAETGASVYIIDSAVTGDGSKNSYLEAMKENVETLKRLVK
jgi:zinc transport system substrate-binding protein